MDPDSLQLGTKNLWSWLVSLLSKDPEWLNAKVKFFLPKMDLSSRNKAEDATQDVMLQLSRLHTQGRATWQAFIHCVCMELDVPLDLEVLLLSTWGHGDGKGRPKRHRAASQPPVTGSQRGQGKAGTHLSYTKMTQSSQEQNAMFLSTFQSKFPIFTVSAGDLEDPSFYPASPQLPTKARCKERKDQCLLPTKKFQIAHNAQDVSFFSTVRSIRRASPLTSTEGQLP